jgi:hypothetical protein
MAQTQIAMDGMAEVLRRELMRQRRHGRSPLERLYVSSDAEHGARWVCVDGYVDLTGLAAAALGLTDR